MERIEPAEEGSENARSDRPPQSRDRASFRPIEKLTDKVDAESRSLSQLEVKLADRFGDMNTKMGSIQTTVKIAGGIATVLAGFAFYSSRNMYQTVFAEGEKVGTIQAKLDVIDAKLNEHLRNQPQPTRYVPPPDTPKLPDPTMPSHVDPIPLPSAAAKGDDKPKIS